MRPDLLLLALLITALALTPCVDVHAETVGSAAVEQLAQDNTTDPHEDQDHCTPFCGCTCCGAVSLQPPSVGLSLERYVAPEKPGERPTYRPTAINSSFGAETWQPPRA